MAEARKIGKKLLLRTGRFSVVEAKMRVRGRIVSKPYISHNDCAQILAIAKPGKILLIKSYRPVLNGYVYEMPSGTLKNGESPLAAAKRELEEETGYIAGKMTHMFSGHPLLGYSDCKLHFFIARGLRKVAQRVEDDESIFVEELEIGRVMNMFMDGKIKDLNVLTALLFYRQC